MTHRLLDAYAAKHGSKYMPVIADMRNELLRLTCKLEAAQQFDPASPYTKELERIRKQFARAMRLVELALAGP